MIDYEEVRVNVAVNAMNALLSSSFMIFIFEFVFRKQLADIAVKYADQLVMELQKNKKQ